MHARLRLDAGPEVRLEYGYNGVAVERRGLELQSYVDT